jgi:aldose sugar dehydrogenase
MLRFFLFLGFVAATVAILCCHRDSNLVATHRSTKLFASQCASCHGPTAEAFADRTWKYGNSRLELIRSIREGYPGSGGQHAFGQKISPERAEELAQYLLGAIISQKEKTLAAGAAKDGVFASAGMRVRLDTVARNLENPWGLVFLPNGDLLVTERSGQLSRISPDGTKHDISGEPAVLVESQGGLLDVEIDPKFAENGLIYLSYSKFRDSADVQLSTTAVQRARLDGNQLTEARDIFVAKPWTTTRYHYGSRLEFDRKGLLYISVGDRGKQDDHPQQLGSDCGKIHRIYPDGHIPTDNPFFENKATRGTIFSYGHRNPQGLALHPTTGLLWETEHGPQGGDEINLVSAGKNYGWPVISYGTHYDDRSFTQLTEKQGLESPKSYWVPSIAPCGLVFSTSDLYPAWKGDLLAGSLRFKYLERIRIDGERIVEREPLLPGVGRVRCVATSPDGYLYVAVEEPGLILRLMPL